MLIKLRHSVGEKVVLYDSELQRVMVREIKIVRASCLFQGKIIETYEIEESVSKARVHFSLIYETVKQGRLQSCETKFEVDEVCLLKNEQVEIVYIDVIFTQDKADITYKVKKISGKYEVVSEDLLEKI